ncbi:MAG: transcription termination factor Rho [bacterium]
MNEQEIDEKFEKLTPTYPNEKFLLEYKPNDYTTRILDIIAPIGKGQRCLLVSPPKAGKTTILKKISTAINKNHPEVIQLALLINERPEEITDFTRNTPARVIDSSADKDPREHVKAADSVLKKARRLLVEGKDILVLLDSITRLARAHNLFSNSRGKTLSGGLDSAAMQQPRRFFGSARNVENGGSLTIIGTSLVQTGSQMDEVIFQEFKGTGNMELVLDRHLAERRFYPAVSVSKSGTRKEEELFNENENRIIVRLRRYLGGLDDELALRFLLDNMHNFKTNAEFLRAIVTGELDLNDLNPRV